MCYYWFLGRSQSMCMDDGLCILETKIERGESWNIHMSW
jgi:hypothetical protein